MGCDYCGSDFKHSLMPFKCKRCSGSFCIDHHLPENHDCVGLKNVNKVHSKEIMESFRDIYGECKKCGEKVYLPFECKYCGYKYCGKHRLPEYHECFGLRDKKSPKPGIVEPGIVEPGIVEPGIVEPGIVEPGIVEFGTTKLGIIDGETEERGSAKTKYPFASVGFIGSILFILGAVFVIGDYHLLALMPMIFLVGQYISIFVK
jgi:predicted nucleic acid binding AN1-type Zn finger protein